MNNANDNNDNNDNIAHSNDKVTTVESNQIVMDDSETLTLLMLLFFIAMIT